jgi:hypothetical protein
VKRAGRLVARLALTRSRPPQYDVLAVARPPRRARTRNTARPKRSVRARFVNPGPLSRTSAPRTRRLDLVSVTRTVVLTRLCTRTCRERVLALHAPERALAPGHTSAATRRT